MSTITANPSDSTRGRLLEDYRGYLLLIARRCLSGELASRIDPEDIVQVTMLRAAKAFPAFRGRTRQQFFHWLMTIHRNTINEELSWQHAAKRTPNRERSAVATVTEPVLYWLEPEDGEPTPSVKLMRDEEAIRLAAALAELTPEQSEAVRLRHLEGWSVERIAEHLLRSPQAVAGLIKRGLANLRTRMK